MAKKRKPHFGEGGEAGDDDMGLAYGGQDYNTLNDLMGSYVQNPDGTWTVVKDPYDIGTMGNPAAFGLDPNNYTQDPHTGEWKISPWVQSLARLPPSGGSNPFASLGQALFGRNGGGLIDWLSLAAPLAGGLINRNAVGQAASQMRDAVNQQNQTLQDMFGKATAAYAPYAGVGPQALSNLQNMPTSALAGKFAPIQPMNGTLASNFGPIQPSNGNLASMFNALGSGRGTAGHYRGGYITGGKVRGPGGPKEDLIDAKLSNGEFVMNAKSTAAHRDQLEKWNEEGKYADGGDVAPAQQNWLLRWITSNASPGSTVSIADAQNRKKYNEYAQDQVDKGQSPRSYAEWLREQLAAQSVPHFAQGDFVGWDPEGNAKYEGPSVGQAGYNPFDPAMNLQSTSFQNSTSAGGGKITQPGTYGAGIDAPLGPASPDIPPEMLISNSTTPVPKVGGIVNSAMPNANPNFANDILGKYIGGTYAQPGTLTNVLNGGKIQNAQGQDLDTRGNPIPYENSFGHMFATSPVFTGGLPGNTEAEKATSYNTWQNGLNPSTPVPKVGGVPPSQLGWENAGSNQGDNPYLGVDPIAGSNPSVSVNGQSNLPYWYTQQSNVSLPSAGYGVNVGNYLNPGTNYAMDTALRAIRQQHAGMGGLDSSGTLKDMLDRAMGIGLNNYNNAFGQAANVRDFNYGADVGDRNFAYNALMGDRAYNTGLNQYNQQFGYNAALNDRNYLTDLARYNQGFGYNAMLNDQNTNWARQMALANFGLGATGQQTGLTTELGRLLSGNLGTLGQINAQGTMGQNNALTNFITQMLNNAQGRSIYNSLPFYANNQVNPLGPSTGDMT